MKKFLVKYGVALFVTCVIMLVVGAFLGYYYEDNQVVLVDLLYYAKPNEMLTDQWMNDFYFMLVPLWAIICQKIK